MTEPEAGGYYVDAPWGWRERLRCKLFPSRLCPLPEAPTHFADCLVTRTVVVLGFLDRCRVLLSGRLTVEVRTVTEHTIGAQRVASVAYPSLKESHEPSGEHR